MQKLAHGKKEARQTKQILHSKFYWSKNCPTCGQTQHLHNDQSLCPFPPSSPFLGPELGTDVFGPIQQIFMFIFLAHPTKVS